MISKQVLFRVYERPDTFRKSGKEWALSAQLVGHKPWTIKAWEMKPSEALVADTKEIVMRSFEFYHKHLHIPRFEMSVVDV